MRGRLTIAMTKSRAIHPDPARPRYDRPGHLDPAHAARLLGIGRSTRGSDDETPFWQPTSHDDDLAEEIGEAAIATMTSGEDTLRRDLDAAVDEERGGPFIETSGYVEFAGGTDESNIEGATREPIPLANHSEDDEEEEEA